MSSASSPVSSNAGKQFYGTGRRRESIARVYIKMGPARFTVNGRPVDEYFRNIAWHTAAVEPLKFTQMQDQIEVKCVGEGRRRRRAVWSRAHGTFARAFADQSRVAASAAQERVLDARFAHEGTQEVRAKGSASPLPVQQALVFLRPGSSNRARPNSRPERTGKKGCCSDPSRRKSIPL